MDYNNGGQGGGAGEGAGFNVNVAWETGKVALPVNPLYGDTTPNEGEEEKKDTEANTGDTDLGCNEYSYAFEELLLPIARQFAPDLILISCGFDSAIHDQLGRSKLCPLYYFNMTRELTKICPKVVVV